MSIRELNQQLMLGQLPDCLNFTPKLYTEIDMSKLQYNAFYKTPEFIISKFENPIAFLNLPGSDKIINYMIENTKSPLEELLEREHENINITIDIIEDGMDKINNSTESSYSAIE